MQSFAGQVGIRIIRPSAALRAPRAVSRPGASGPASSPPCDVGGRNPSRSPKLYRAVTRSSTGPRRTTTTTRPTWPGTAPAPLPLTRSPPPRRRPASPRRLAHRLLISRPPLCVTSNPAWPSRPGARVRASSWRSSRRRSSKTRSLARRPLAGGGLVAVVVAERCSERFGCVVCRV